MKNSARQSHYNGVVHDFTYHLNHTDITYTFNDQEIENLSNNIDKIVTRITLRKQELEKTHPNV